MILSPEQCRAARGLLDWTQEKLASSAGVSRSMVRDFEGRRHNLHRASEALLVRTLRAAGITLLSSRDGRGVRLKTRAGMESVASPRSRQA
jgi:transcriptional regulator with XRE-family HTH domain